MNIFKKKKEEIKELIDYKYNDGCMATNMITIEGWKVGYMYRDEPSTVFPDSGWRFFKGDEDYSNNPDNYKIHKLNTICNYDEYIIPYLNMPVGTYLIRTKNNKFVVDDGKQEIFIAK
jgi:hypothetical protein